MRHSLISIIIFQISSGLKFPGTVLKYLDASLIIKGTTLPYGADIFLDLKTSIFAHITGMLLSRASSSITRSI